MPQSRVQINRIDTGKRTAIPIDRVLISSPAIGPALDGVTLAMLADLHAGIRRGGALAITRLVADVMDVGADAICLLGDTVHRAHSASQHLAPLQALEAPLGVYAVLGNHEHGTVWYSRLLRLRPEMSPKQWRELYRSLGVRLLVNESRRLKRDGEHLWLIGVDDAYSGHDDLQAALSGISDGNFRLAITHFPDLIDDPAASRLDFICAGHTHGSQVHLPLIGPLYTSSRKPRERALGLMRENGTFMYVTRGCGEGIPLRFRCPREITLVTLEHGETGREDQHGR